MSPSIRIAPLALALALGALPASAQTTAPAAPQTPAASPGPEAQTWSTFHGNLAAQKYSTASQITPENVGSLEKAWEVHTGDVSDGTDGTPPSFFNATPLFVNDTVYIGTPFYRIMALDPGTGQSKWVYDSQSTLKALTQPGLKTRGVSYWQAANPQPGTACEKRVYLGTMDARIHAVDADTGQPCTDFGDNGIVNINQWNTTNDVWPLSVLQPPTVSGDQLFVGWAGWDWQYQKSPPGTVFALDARTGEKNWELNTLPESVRAQFGTANVWTAMSVDEERGILYLPVSSPEPNYYGGDRAGVELPLVTSVTAVNVKDGSVLWSYQIVKHDVWDYDTNAAPTLADLTINGESVPALIQTTKMGQIFVLNRVTGEPIFPVEERPVSQAGAVAGEQLSPTQKFATTPEPMNDPTNWPGLWWLGNVTSFGGCSRDVRDVSYEGLYTPPTDKGQGTLFYPATSGGIQWGGGSINPQTGLYIVNTSEVVETLKLIPRAEYEKFIVDRKEGSASESGIYPQNGSPYGFQLKVLRNWLGIPCWKPPYGTIAAYDMPTGKKVWEHPFGMSQYWGFYGMRSWGSPNIGGPVQTAGGLIFIGASMDSRVRALSVETGEELWSDIVDAPANSIPAVYTWKGRQYVVFTAGGNQILTPRVSDQVVAYALPE